MYQNGKNITFTDRSNNSVNMFLRNIRKSAPLTTAEEYELWQLMQQGDQRARERLIFANLRYVVTLAKQYLASGAALDDLLMAGSLGITKAADLFDARQGHRFISFATWYIRSEIQKVAYDHIRHHSSNLSLDQPISAYDDDSDTLLSRLPSDSASATDWHVCFEDSLNALKRQLDKNCWMGAGELLDDYINMTEKGYTPTDFARKYHITSSQQRRFLEIVNNESRQLLQAA